MFWIFFLLLFVENVIEVKGSNDFYEKYRALQEECLNNSKSTLPSNMDMVKCPVSFHGSCWRETLANITVSQTCPEVFFIPSGNITRRCNESGYWEKPDISSCVPLHPTPSATYNYIEHVRQVRVYVAVSWVSVSIMVPSLLFTVYLLKGRNERFNVHINLIIAFILRTTTFFVHHYGDLDRPGHSITVCNVLWVANRYFAAAEITWMLNEALLLLRKVVIIFDKKPYLKYYMVIGWGAPFVLISAVYVPVMVGVVDRPTRRCWTYYKDSVYMLVLYIPLVLILMINFCTLIYTVTVFVKRQRVRTTPQDDFLKLRKAIKGTLILSPLLGVIYLLIFFQPNTIPVWYEYVLRIIYPMQGTLACLVYITFSGELRNKVKMRYRSSIQGRRSLVDNAYYWSVTRMKNPDKSPRRRGSRSSSHSVDHTCQTRASPCITRSNCPSTDAIISPDEEPCITGGVDVMETTEM